MKAAASHRYCQGEVAMQATSGAMAIADRACLYRRIVFKFGKRFRHTPMRTLQKLKLLQFSHFLQFFKTPETP
jgi:hypothetical protein